MLILVDLIVCMYYVYTAFMASIQSKISRGNKYWYIVESKRVNGKPRPIVLEYLGKPDDLLRRLRGLADSIKIKSYSHGAVAALLNIAAELDIVPIINKYINSPRSYTAKKPLRNNLTAGATYLLGSIGRVCMPTSKLSWWQWAKETSLQYLLSAALSKIDSQHFWDLMDALPEDAIEKIECEILQKVMEKFAISHDSLFYDTTNFFTFIHTTNSKCTIAQRGKNKQKRYDLRQVGMALVVTRQDLIPLFHHTYQGNMNDAKVFGQVIKKIKTRMETLGLDLEKHSLVFDRGNNSKANMAMIKKLGGIHYVGALTPYHNKQLIADADEKYEDIDLGDDQYMRVYRDKREIWGEERTVLIYVSRGLKSGQIRGIYQNLEKKKKQLKELKDDLLNPRAKSKTEEGLTKKIQGIVKGQFITGVIDWHLTQKQEGKFTLDFSINEKKLQEVEDKMGFRILMTDRHQWSSAEIIKAYLGQSKVEYAFKNTKNPYHIAFRPQFHWTDQKIKVHYFMCILGYLLTTLVQYKVKSKKAFEGNIDNLLDRLNEIRLTTLLEESDTPGRIKSIHKLEEMDDEQQNIMQALEINDYHVTRPKLNGLSVYN